MQQFLFIVQIPPVPDNSAGITEAPSWVQFSHEAGIKIKSLKSCLKLQSNAWMFPVENSLQVMTELVAIAGAKKLSYSCILIPDGAIVLANDDK